MKYASILSNQSCSTGSVCAPASRPHRALRKDSARDHIAYAERTMEESKGEAKALSWANMCHRLHRNSVAWCVCSRSRRQNPDGSGRCLVCRAMCSKTSSPCSEVRRTDLGRVPGRAFPPARRAVDSWRRCAGVKRVWAHEAIDCSAEMALAKT